jgi:hypothetical protein
MTPECFRVLRCTSNDRAINLLDAMESSKFGVRPLSFVVHSLGGIIVKQMLRTAERNERLRKLLTSTRGIVFLATCTWVAACKCRECV